MDKKMASTESADVKNIQPKDNDIHYDKIVPEYKLHLVRSWHKSSSFCLLAARAYRQYFIQKPTQIRDRETLEAESLECKKKNQILVKRLIEMLNEKKGSTNTNRTYIKSLLELTDFKRSTITGNMSGAMISAIALEDFVFAHNVERGHKLSGNKHFICCYCFGLYSTIPDYNSMGLGLSGKSEEEQKLLILRVMTARTDLIDMFHTLKKQVRSQSAIILSSITFVVY